MEMDEDFQGLSVSGVFEVSQTRHEQAMVVVAGKATQAKGGGMKVNWWGPGLGQAGASSMLGLVFAPQSQMLIWHLFFSHFGVYEAQ